MTPPPPPPPPHLDVHFCPSQYDIIWRTHFFLNLGEVGLLSCFLILYGLGHTHTSGADILLTEKSGKCKNKIDLSVIFA